MFEVTKVPAVCDFPSEFLLDSECFLLVSAKVLRFLCTVECAVAMGA